MFHIVSLAINKDAFRCAVQLPSLACTLTFPGDFITVLTSSNAAQLVPDQPELWVIGMT